MTYNEIIEIFLKIIKLNYKIIIIINKNMKFRVVIIILLLSASDLLSDGKCTIILFL